MNQPITARRGSAPVSRGIVSDLLEQGFELIETHISWVFRGGDEVFKVKKPVYFGFLDFRSLEGRRRACDIEVEINRRLAPGVYRDVVPITRAIDGRYFINGRGDVVEWAVRMRRLDDTDRADRMLEDGRLTGEHIEELARSLAMFHGHARHDARTASFGSLRSLQANICENLDQTDATILDHLQEEEADRVRLWQLDFVSENADLLEERARSGRVRDGHGDLRLEHVYFEGEGMRIIDRIEFNERFRYADVCADLAFLAMDLVYHDRWDLAELLIARYARATGDYDLYRVVDFYQSYRAFVRAKIASFAASDTNASSAIRAAAAASARRYFCCALAFESAPLVIPQVIAVGGMIASGKSTIAEALGEQLGAPVVDTDRARKALCGVSDTTSLSDSAFSGAYSTTVTERVYDEVFRRAALVLDAGRPVVIDATFRSAAQRERARELARERCIDFIFVECRVDSATALSRLQERSRAAHVSDGNAAVYNEFVSSWQPVKELADSEHLIVNTVLPLEQNLEFLSDRIADSETGSDDGCECTEGS